MGISTLLLATLAGFAAVVTASPQPERRQAASTVSVTVTAESVVTQETPTTRTLHPSDVISTITFGTDIQYLFTTTRWALDTCITYSYTGYNLAPSQVATNPTILPETTRRPSTSTVIVTVTRTRTTTIPRETLVTVTDRPPTTSVTWTVVTSTSSAGLTVRSSVCTNTGVVSAYLRYAETRTSTSGQTYTRVVVTAPCANTEIVSRTVPGLDPKQVVTRQPGLYERFTDGTTLATSVQPSEYFTTVVFTAVTATITSTVCNNPTTLYTSIYYTQTSTRWATATVTSCPALAARDEIFALSPEQEANAASGTYTTVLGLDGEAAAALVAPVTEAAERATFTTVVLLSPTIVSTFTGTGVLQTVTPTLTTVVMRGETVYVDSTRTTTICAQTPVPKL